MLWCAFIACILYIQPFNQVALLRWETKAGDSRTWTKRKQRWLKKWRHIFAIFLAPYMNKQNELRLNSSLTKLSEISSPLSITCATFFFLCQTKTTDYCKLSVKAGNQLGKVFRLQLLTLFDARNAFSEWKQESCLDCIAFDWPSGELIIRCVDVHTCFKSR